MLSLLSSTTCSARSPVVRALQGPLMELAMPRRHGFSSRGCLADAPALQPQSTMTEGEALPSDMTKRPNLLPRAKLFNTDQPPPVAGTVENAIRSSISPEGRNAELAVEKNAQLRNVRAEAKASSDRMVEAPAVAGAEVRDPYWQRVHPWQNVSEQDFLSCKWQTANSIRDKDKLLRFLAAALPEKIDPTSDRAFGHIRTREDFIRDVDEGIQAAPMAIRLTPHILAVVDWNDALTDPIRRQYIPMRSTSMPDHPMLTLDSLNEEGDSPVKGLVHRYPDKALFLATSICPLYCRFCTRSYAVGLNTDTVAKKTLKPTKQRWDDMFDYVERTPALSDIVVSGGDSYLLTPEQLYDIGRRLISIKHIRRFRFASKGLAVWPSRILDPKDGWSSALIEVSQLARRHGKWVALHTHFNHPSEITWLTRLASQRLFENGVTVRNQTVLLRGVNDSVEVMSSLIRRLADMNIQPYYVYQGDLIKGVEDLRTPLQTSLDLETQIRGSIAGFLMPQFVIDLPGGGGKRLSTSYLSYDRSTGISTFVAPAVKRERDGLDRVYKYYDPLWSLQTFHGSSERSLAGVARDGAVEHRVETLVD